MSLCLLSKCLIFYQSFMYVQYHYIHDERRPKVTVSLAYCPSITYSQCIRDLWENFNGSTIGSIKIHIIQRLAISGNTYRYNTMFGYWPMNGWIVTWPALSLRRKLETLLRSNISIFYFTQSLLSGLIFIIYIF